MVPEGETACGYARYLVARPDQPFGATPSPIPEHDVCCQARGLDDGEDHPTPAYLRMCGS